MWQAPVIGSIACAVLGGLGGVIYNANEACKTLDKKPMYFDHFAKESGELHSDVLSLSKVFTSDEGKQLYNEMHKNVWLLIDLKLNLKSMEKRQSWSTQAEHYLFQIDQLIYLLEKHMDTGLTDMDRGKRDEVAQKLNRILSISQSVESNIKIDNELMHS